MATPARFSTKPHVSDGTDFSHWCSRLQSYIMAEDYDIWIKVSHAYVIPEAINTAAEKTAFEQNCKARNILLSGISRSDYDRVAHLQTAHEIWVALSNFHQGTNNIKELRRDLFKNEYIKFEMKPGEALDDYLSRNRKRGSPNRCSECGSIDHLRSHCPKLGRGKREDKDGEKTNNNKPNNNKSKGSYQGRKMENLRKAIQQVCAAFEPLSDVDGESGDDDKGKNVSDVCFMACGESDTEYEDNEVSAFEEAINILSAKNKKCVSARSSEILVKPDTNKTVFKSAGIMSTMNASSSKSNVIHAKSPVVAHVAKSTNATNVPNHREKYTCSFCGKDGHIVGFCFRLAHKQKKEREIAFAKSKWQKSGFPSRKPVRPQWVPRSDWRLVKPAAHPWSDRSWWNFSENSKNDFARGYMPIGSSGHVSQYWIPKFLLSPNPSTEASTSACVYALVARKENVWIVDFGCSRHMTGDKNWFSSLKKASKTESIIFGDAATSAVLATGLVKVNENFELKNVALVEDLKYNLLSVSQIVDENFEVHFKKTRSKVFDSCGDSVLNISRYGRVFKADFENPVSPVITCLVAKFDKDMMFWHRRLGHVGFDHLTRLSGLDLVRGLRKLKKDLDLVCTPCRHAKMDSTSHAPIVFVMTDAPGQLLHMDTVGPARVQSVGGKWYVLVIVDDFSRYSWVFFMATKDEAFQHFRGSFLRLDLEFPGSLKRIRSDNGGEFKNALFEQFCNGRGLEHEFSSPHVPQQNGVVERKNRVLVEMARTMLDEYKTPRKFGAEAINTACYISNRVFMRSKLGKTSYELRFGHQPKVSHLCVFGCKCFVLKSGNLDKFEARSTDGLFLGYPAHTRDYRVLILGTIKIVETCEVSFDEASPGTRPEIAGERTIRSKVTTHVVCANSAFVASFEPKDMLHALTDESWINAMHEELENFERNKVWTLVEPPSRHNIIGTKWVFKNRLNEDGLIVRNKTRLVAQGFTQVESLDFDETFAPVARIEAIRLLLAFAASKGFKLYQMDVKSAFLNGFIQEEVYVKQPPGFENPDFPNHVFKLSKALYGLKQAPRAWYDRLKNFLLAKGFTMGKVDKTLFVLKHGDNQLFVQIYVDDIIFGCSTHALVVDFAETMRREFEMSMMGELSYFLRLQIKQTPQGTFVHQTKYTKDLLRRLKMENCKPISTPIGSTAVLDPDEDGEVVDQKEYRSMIGSLLYLTASRPDIQFAVCLCARFQASPRTSHRQAVKRIMRYLNHTLEFRIWYSTSSSICLSGYSDADFGGCRIDRKSTSGTCHFLGTSLIGWSSRKQSSVGQSTAESEYVAAASCCSQILWLLSTLKDYGLTFEKVPLFCDNTSAINIAKNPVQYSRTKHIDIRFHFLRDHVEKGDVELQFLDTKLQIADIFTEPLDSNRFAFLRGELGIIHPFGMV
uniref:Retrotransposon protein, putative, unclassified n=1 Tax=Oryza sativa subsp. japonica TaxID=39947 RepID=Q2QP29_ORYSJ|nr:retrotransposon protein, putative, unclassified [Oryza sativa Japonica Group]